jgi:septal ring factor EnvC (AmiA/AmiB activator)
MKSGKQCFKLKDIPSAEMKRLRITILENFGDRCTYLNQVELGFEEDPTVINPVREKVFSEYVKLTSTERELKKTQEQVARLTMENLSIKQTLLRQGETIIEMQHALKAVTKELQKLQRNQEVQSHPLLVGMHKDDEISSIINRKLQSKLNYATN